MQYTYWCGVCQTISSHLSWEDAEDERMGHSDRVHDGRHPEDESISGPLPPAPRFSAREIIGSWCERHDRQLTQLALLAIAVAIITTVFESFIKMVGHILG